MYKPLLTYTGDHCTATMWRDHDNKEVQIVVTQQAEITVTEEGRAVYVLDYTSIVRCDEAMALQVQQAIVDHIDEEYEKGEVLQVTVDRIVSAKVASISKPHLS